MHWIFTAITDRVKALILGDVALDLESRFVSRQADRKADLLRQADRFEEEGLASVAEELRTQAEAITTNRPLATVLPAMAELGQGTESKSLPEPTTTNGKGAPRLAAASSTTTKSRSRKRK